MIKRTISVVALFAVGSPAIALAPKEPLSLKPTSAWHVDYAEDRCRLVRRFGEGDEQVYAFFDRFGPTEYFRLTVAGKLMRTSTEKSDGKLQFGPAEFEQEFSFFTGNVGINPALVFLGDMRVAPPTGAEFAAVEKRDKSEWIEYAPINEARQKAIKYLIISKPLRRSVLLETGPMHAPLTALDKCIDDLVTTWGIDVEKHKTLTRKVKPLQSPGKWVVSSDYPLGMLSAGQPAIVDFRLSVGADGVPSACHIQATTRPRAFDDAVCKSVMRRAQFDPARDSEGMPLPSYYHNTVRFQIPK